MRKNAWLRWIEGRQGTGYRKMLLAALAMPRPLHRFFRGFDAYLLWYPEGTEIPTHTDPIPGYRHYRINWIIHPAVRGGEFFAERPIWNGKRLKIFPSDESHSVSPIESGTRVVLSIGFCIGE